MDFPNGDIEGSETIKRVGHMNLKLQRFDRRRIGPRISIFLGKVTQKHLLSETKEMTREFSQSKDLSLLLLNPSSTSINPSSSPLEDQSSNKEYFIKAYAVEDYHSYPFLSNELHILYKLNELQSTSNNNYFVSLLSTFEMTWSDDLHVHGNHHITQLYHALAFPLIPMYSLFDIIKQDLAKATGEYNSSVCQPPVFYTYIIEKKLQSNKSENETTEEDNEEFVFDIDTFHYQHYIEIIYQIYDVLSYLHAHSIVHLNTILDNILYSPITHQIKVIDFKHAYDFSEQSHYLSNQELYRLIQDVSFDNINDNDKVKRNDKGNQDNQEKKIEEIEGKEQDLTIFQRCQLADMVSTTLTMYQLFFVYFQFIQHDQLTNKDSHFIEIIPLSYLSKLKYLYCKDHKSMISLLIHELFPSQELMWNVSKDFLWTNNEPILSLTEFSQTSEEQIHLIIKQQTTNLKNQTSHMLNSSKLELMNHWLLGFLHQIINFDRISHAKQQILPITLPQIKQWIQK